MNELDYQEFYSGLEVFSERYMKVQKELSEIEKHSPLFQTDMTRYRKLLDEWQQIGSQRAVYCSSFRQRYEPD